MVTLQKPVSKSRLEENFELEITDEQRWCQLYFYKESNVWLLFHYYFL